MRFHPLYFYKDSPLHKHACNDYAGSVSEGPLQIISGVPLLIPSTFC